MQPTVPTTEQIEMQTTVGTYTVDVRHTPARPYVPAMATLAVQSPTGRTYTVEVRGPDTTFGGEHVPPTVNWSAYGSVAAADAVLYGALVQLAAQVGGALEEYVDECGQHCPDGSGATCTLPAGHDDDGDLVHVGRNAAGQATTWAVMHEED